MILKIKKIFYFPIAFYFRFFAIIQLNLWKPTVIVITGSSGKTTLLHLIESQLKDRAKYSYNANSSFGIPFDILGLKRKSFTFDEWIYLFLKAPFMAFKKIPLEKIYVVEADCDRVGEGKFLASLLKPEITLWTSLSLTHSLNFDYLVKNKNFSNVLEAISYEFGYFLEYSKKLAIINGDSSYIEKQLQRTQIKIQKVFENDLTDYKIYKNRTEFIIENKKYSINFIVPKNVFYLIKMTKLLLDNLNFPFDPNFSKFNLPKGRSSLFKGIKNISIIDSTYNATPDAVLSILNLFDQYPESNKWLILGDMIELGNEEESEHEKLANLINSMSLKKIILVGPRVSKYTYPKLKNKDISQNFLMPYDALNYILKNINGEEVMLFKGARFLEGIIEHLLYDKNDIKKLVRREKAWQNRRKAFGL